MAEKKKQGPKDLIKEQRAEIFAKSFMENGGNLTEAYKSTFPDSQHNSAAANVHKYSKNPLVLEKVVRAMASAKIKLGLAVEQVSDNLVKLANEGTRPIKIGGKMCELPVKSDDTQKNAMLNVLELVLGKTKDEGKAAPGKIEIYDFRQQIVNITPALKEYHKEMLAERKGEKAPDKEGIDYEEGEIVE